MLQLRRVNKWQLSVPDVLVCVCVVCTGKGSCMTVNGEIEMDASIMDGSTLNAGAVACIQNVANPIKVARLVMEKVHFIR